MRNIALILSILVGTFAVAKALGVATDRAGCVAMGAVFCFTALGHFVQPRALQEMIPPWVPARGFLVGLSGCFEVALAGGLFWARTAGLVALVSGFSRSAHAAQYLCRVQSSQLWRSSCGAWLFMGEITAAGSVNRLDRLVCLSSALSRSMLGTCPPARLLS